MEGAAQSAQGWSDSNKAGDLLKLRESVLSKELEEHKEVKELKGFRLQTARAAFKKAWQERD